MYNFFGTNDKIQLSDFKVKNFNNIRQFHKKRNIEGNVMVSFSATTLLTAKLI